MFKYRYISQPPISDRDKTYLRRCNNGNPAPSGDVIIVSVSLWWWWCCSMTVSSSWLISCDFTRDIRFNAPLLFSFVGVCNGCNSSDSFDFRWVRVFFRTLRSPCKRRGENVSYFDASIIMEWICSVHGDKMIYWRWRRATRWKICYSTATTFISLYIIFIESYFFYVEARWDILFDDLRCLRITFLRPTNNYSYSKYL